MHVKELLSLKGKIVLVTGGAGRYGRPIVEALAEADATVITASRNLESGEKVAAEFCQRGLDVQAMRVDQGDHDSVVQLKKAIGDRLGRLDVLINNAVARPMKGYDSPLSEWEESMRINATGLFDITREMAELIAEGGGGAIINIASMMGMFGPDLSNYEGTKIGIPMPDYFFHKGGMITLTRYLARVLADRKIRVNCISPGGLYAGQEERFVANYSRKVPVGRMAEHDDIKGLVVFLASPASAYINGENILIDGGMHA
ncbi:MAG TPA: SDR family oxidoreductase [bacterium]|jgi:NAD(P)-dependent dehydrogenase (short-subunit alcohol dehydrogenase family)|nr:SDR family oxidoreductase [bacterium]HPG46178.1 SDR family oxidoreductase [bacterium]HPM98193.1 SDR family oxidoreductase [bacterium]